MMKNYLKAANWEIFLLTTGLFVVLCYIFCSTTLNYYNASVTTSEKWEVIPNLFQTIIALLSIFYVTILLWAFSVVKKFKTVDFNFWAFVGVSIIPILSSIFLSYKFYNLHQTGATIFPFLEWDLVLSFFVSAISIIYSTYQVSKIIVNAAENKNFSTLNLKSVFIRVLIFPVGIWKIQNVVNKLSEE